MLKRTCLQKKITPNRAVCYAAQIDIFSAEPPPRNQQPRTAEKQSFVHAFGYGNTHIINCGGSLSKSIEVTIWVDPLCWEHHAAAVPLWEGNGRLGVIHCGLTEGTARGRQFSSMCFTSTETARTIRDSQDVHFVFHTAPELFG